ncbi:uncharacterized protein LOC116847912 isoform X4 [Odontomachus brunneus]|uniref:uncharacterized protein LOC116847912 isoform X4 n=1 Tax=Odontomachus brunneus TaxID=486640 RepID=UPI0013F2AA1A|nr:uncharacterized protein LOC116847912 isoform X4 [Odontomachus brunneus]
MDDTRINDEVPFTLNRVTTRMERNSEEYRGEPLKNESENESNDEDYTRSPVLLDLDENTKQQQQKAARREANSPNTVPAVRDRRLQDQLTPSDETTTTLTTRSQPLRGGRWQGTGYESARQQNPEGVLVIRVPEPEIIGSHSQLEMLHETNIKSVQQEPSQTEKAPRLSHSTNATSIELCFDSTILPRSRPCFVAPAPEFGFVSSTWRTSEVGITRITAILLRVYGKGNRKYRASFNLVPFRVRIKYYLQDHIAFFARRDR